MNDLLAHVKFFNGEWIVEFSRGGADAANAFTRQEMMAMVQLWTYLESVASAAKPDPRFVNKSATITLHQRREGFDAWYLGSEAVA